MRSGVKKSFSRLRSGRQRTLRRRRGETADSTIRRMGEGWARHWNEGELEGVVAAYAEDAVYLPPHHEAVHRARCHPRVLKGAAEPWRD